MSSVRENMRINGDRLWDSIMEMSKIGPGIAGGNNRQTLTDDDAKGRELFKKWCENENLSLALDTMGNMFARREGADPNLLPVMVGSHLDTQPTGGKYDGVLGVLSGLEIIRTLNELGVKTKHRLSVVWLSTLASLALIAWLAITSIIQVNNKMKEIDNDSII